jgi:hypothetical protein
MRILFRLLFALTFSLSNAQTYLPILDETNRWSADVFYCPFTPNPPFTWTVTEQISINGTEEINGVIYKQILKDGEPSCLLREENGVVYKYHPSSNSEHIMFNFNLEVGDEYSLIDSGLNSPHCSGGPHNIGIWFMEVSEIETQYIAGTDRKVIKFVDKWFPQQGTVLWWIEGIGTTAGLAIPWAFQDITCGTSLACFSNQGTTYFIGNATSCDNTTLGMTDFSSEEIILYPNPVTNTSILRLPSDLSVDLIRIYDINGRLLKQESISKDYFSIKVMDFRSGLYFYQVFSSGEHLKTGQFIVK